MQNEFVELGEPISNNKVVGKILRVMLRRSRWESMISALEVLSGVQPFTPDELFAHLRSCEEKLRQAGVHEQTSKTIALPAQKQNPTKDKHTTPKILHPQMTIS